MAFRDIFTGGACNANDSQQQQRNQNPFMQLMNNVFQGQAQNREKMENFFPQQQGDIIEQQMKERELMMQMMGNEWSSLEQQFQDKAKIDQDMHRMMEEQFRQEQIAHQQMLDQQAKINEQVWQQADQQQKAEEWANELNMNESWKISEQNNNITDDQEQQKVKEAANDMFNQMLKDEDPRFKNSKFLQFLGQLRTGELQIKGKELIQGDPNIQLEKNLQDSWNDAQTQQQNVNQMMDNVYQQATEEYKKDEQLLNKVWQEAEKQQNEDLPDLEQFWAEKIKEYEKSQQDEQKFGQMLEDQYKSTLQQMNDTEDYDNLMNDAWQKASDIEEHELYRDSQKKYNFSPNNPYLTHDNPMQLAMEFLAQGKQINAILAMEAQLQKDPNNPSNGNTWRIMGRLHQENDQDQKAVSSLLQAQDYDNKNLDTLLALGISCTNILDEIQAMHFMKQWFQNNKFYEQINQNPNIFPQIDKDKPDGFTTDEIKNINQAMINVFEQAQQLNPNDPELLSSLAVLYFIARQYEKSVDLFRAAINFDKDNYSLWNKLGATLAHLGKADEAMEAYHKALDIKPTYVRVWVNLGIAHAYKGDYPEAARFYLNALSFNPDAKHIWSYLQTTFMCMQRFDLVAAIKDQDVRSFAKEFEILNLEELPQPEINYIDTNQQFIIKDKVENLLNQFLKK